MKKYQIISLLALSAILASCNVNSSTSSSGNSSSSSGSSSQGGSSSSTSSYDYDDFDVDSEIAHEDYEADSDEVIDAKITLDGDNATITNVNNDSPSIEITDDGVNINAVGTYLIEGTSIYNKRIKIEYSDKAETLLILNGVGISVSSGNAPIYAASKAQLKIKKAKNSKNYIVDNRPTTYDEDDSAAIFANKKLSIVGKGSLTVVGNCKNGVASDASITLQKGTLTVVAYNNAVKCHKDIEVNEGTYHIKSNNGQCFKTEMSSDATDSSDCTITINGGDFILDAKEDAIEADNDITIVDGTFQIETADGNLTAPSDSEDSAKGIKSETNITISGGTFYLKTHDDSIHSNGNITINGGSIQIESGDDGIHADEVFTLTDGNINILKSYEGIEAETLNFNGGTTHIVSSDDGINAAGGSDSSKTNPWSSGSTGTLYINDGYIFINASGDGLDSNGSIYVSGGYTVVAGPTDGGNGPLDVGDGGSYYLSQSGGTLIAYGSNSMAINASQGSQKTMLFNHNNSINSSYYYVVKDSSGNILNLIKPYKTSSSLYYSVPSLTSTTYTLSYVSATSLSAELTEVFEGVYTTTSSISGETTIGSINLTSTTNGSYGSSGQGGGGHGGQGGGPGGR